MGRLHDDEAVYASSRARFPVASILRRPSVQTSARSVAQNVAVTVVPVTATVAVFVGVVGAMKAYSTS